MRRLQSIIKSFWFLQKLFVSFCEKLIIRHDLNDENVKNLNFVTLVSQALALVKSKKMMKNVRKTRFKNDRTTTLIKKMKRKMRKKNEKTQTYELISKSSLSQVASMIAQDKRMKDITNAMRNLTMNMNNLMNCVILTFDKQQRYFSSQNATNSSSIFFQSAVSSTSLSQKIVFFAFFWHCSSTFVE